jgi:mannosyltransferase
VAFLPERRYDWCMIQTMVDRLRSRQLERYFGVTLLAAAAGAVIISLMIGLRQSVWFDEAYSVLLAKQPVLDLIRLTSVDAQPPLYYLLLKGWASVFGWSELALRSFSAIAMGGAVILGALLVKRTFGVRAALMALPFVALSPLLLRYGFEIQMYALGALIGIAATYTLVSALQTKLRSRQWKLYALYAVLLTLGLYTHYLMVLLWLAHLAWLIGRAYSNKQPIAKTPWFVALVGSTILFLPWIPVVVAQINDGTQSAVLQVMTIENLVGIVSFAFLYQPPWLLGGLGTAVVLFVIISLGVLAIRAFKKASKKEREYLWLFTLYLLIPVLLIALVSLWKPLYLERYVSLFVVGAMLGVGVIVSYTAKKLSSWTGLVVFVLYAALLFGVGQLAVEGNTNYQRLQKPDVKEAAASIKSCEQDTTVFAADPYTAIELSYYLPSCEIRFYSTSDTFRGGYAPLSNSPLRIAQPSTELINSSQLYYVYYDEPRLTMPINLAEVSHNTYGKLNVDTFMTE